jgi:hypothetical protein
VVQANSDARLGALRDALRIVALLAVAANFLTGLIPTGQHTDESSSTPA